MAVREPVDLTFGAQTFKVRSLTLAQVERMDVAVKEKKDGVALAKEIVAAALSRDHAHVDVDSLEVDLPEMMDAMAGVLKLAGFVPSGEAKAAASNASIGAA